VILEVGSEGLEVGGESLTTRHSMDFLPFEGQTFIEFNEVIAFKLQGLH
jgi:hypothetical protein